MNNYPNPNNRQERIFKIFTPVRCMNRDQLPRYVQDNMTEVEKHLVEQHLVDCDLCCAAVQALEQQHYHEPFEKYSTELSNYLHREYSPAPKKQRQQYRTHKSARTRESLLSYFWTIMFIAIGGGSIFLLQQHLKNRPAAMVLPVKTAGAADFQPPAVPAAHIDSTYNEDEPAPPLQLSHPPVATAAPKDTVKRVPPPVRDSTLANKNAPVTVKDTPKSTPAVTDTAKRTAARTPDTVKKEAPKPERTVAAKEPEKKEPAAEETPKAAPAPVSGDESLFRAAMQYQQQGNVNEAIDQFRKLSTNYRYAERAKFQLALCYRTKGQNAKARRLLREIVKMNGNMQDQAQAQLDNMN
ncbi:tetratricopeptide repeat protein [Chitinophaga sp. XS-30]|uniref:tetratricopeptide repeat protein n=1 Tax=Chitinophaga sp. XS-30 TaxID=2604421 RepID=UPI0011DD336A|nr:tetratricopeptide repeat protein [Chitinophaga sp. XS-30]QEH42846.1 tetratricopeptide repeat protein [Chitinophaga sp. XS-30]